MSSAGLFFSLIIAYIIPVFSFITEKTIQAMDDLRTHMKLGDDRFFTLRNSIDHKSILWTCTTIGTGVALAFMHLLILGSSPIDVLLGILEVPATLTDFVGILLIWTVMTTVIGSLTANATFFARLGRDEVKIRILETSNLLPFARVAVISTLALIGALAFFPLLFLDEQAQLYTALPGMLATGLPMVILFVVPVWPVHKRILEAKNRELEVIRKELEHKSRYLDNPAKDPSEIEQIVPMLNYRREISSISSWPFDIGNLTRLALYLVIPPLTWVGGALIEKLLDAFI